MKVWEALQVLEKMDPNVEVTLGFQDYSKKNKNKPPHGSPVPTFSCPTDRASFNDWRNVQ
jgi:hypothetical protein